MSNRWICCTNHITIILFCPKSKIFWTTTLVFIWSSIARNSNSFVNLIILLTHPKVYQYMHYKNSNILPSLQEIYPYHLIDHHIHLSSHFYYSFIRAQSHPTRRRRSPPYLFSLSSQLSCIFVVKKFVCAILVACRHWNLGLNKIIMLFLNPPHLKCRTRSCLKFQPRYISINIKIHTHISIHPLLNITSGKKSLITNLITLV